jgi:hypothetical protein
MAVRVTKAAILAFLLAVPLAAPAAEVLSATLRPPIGSWQAPGTFSSTGKGLPTESADLSGPVPFIPVTPCRVIDTRAASGFPPGYGPPSMLGGQTQRSFTIAGQCGVPGVASAVSFNFTVWAPVTRGDIRVFPAPGPTPTVSTLNWEANILALANAAVVPMGAGGAITVQVDGPGTIDLIVDINGYYSTTPASSLYPFQVTTNSTFATIQATNLSTSCPTGTACGVSAAVSSGTAISGSSATGGDGVYGTSADASAAGVHGFLNQNFAGSKAVWGEHQGTSAGIYGVYGSVNTLVGGNYGVYSLGNMGASGTKPFVEPHPTDPKKVIRYVALEGPEAGTYFRGKAFVHRGVAEIDVPDSFRIVTDEEGLTVHVTPVGRAQAWVDRADLNQIVIGASRDVAINYIVHGVRKAYKDWEVVADGVEYMPSGPDAQMPLGLSDEARRRLIANGTYHADGTVNMDTAARVGWTAIWEAQGAHLKASPAPAPADSGTSRK